MITVVDSKSYFQLLQDPKWQKRRLEVMAEADFACEMCDARDKPLHVHHTYYEKNRKPWEYPRESLRCLCQDCHHRAQDIATELKRQWGRLSQGDHEMLYGYGLGLEAMSRRELVLDVPSYEVAQGIADAWELTAEEILAALREGVIDGELLNALRSAARSITKEHGLRRRIPPKTISTKRRPKG